MLSSALRVKGGGSMNNLFNFILAVAVQSKPLRLGEEWWLLVQMARRGKPVWLVEDPPRSGQAKLEIKEMIISQLKKTSLQLVFFWFHDIVQPHG